MAEPIPLVRTHAVPLVRLAAHREPTVIVDPALYEEAARQLSLDESDVSRVARKLRALVDPPRD